MYLDKMTLMQCGKHLRWFCGQLSVCTLIHVFSQYIFLIQKKLGYKKLESKKKTTNFQKKIVSRA